MKRGERGFGPFPQYLLLECKRAVLSLKMRSIAVKNAP